MQACFQAADAQHAVLIWFAECLRPNLIVDDVVFADGRRVDAAVDTPIGLVAPVAFRHFLSPRSIRVRMARFRAALVANLKASRNIFSASSNATFRWP